MAPSHVRLDGAALDLVQPQVIGLVPQVFGHFALGEGAKFAFEIADVGVVDVAVDDITDGVAVHFGPQAIGGPADGAEIIAARRKQAR